MDVERWHEWTASIRSSEKITPGELRVGLKVRIKQPKLPVAEWTISSIEPGRRLEWQSTAPGAKTVAWHAVEPDGTSARAVLGIDQSGVFFTLMGWYFNGMTRRYVNMELEGLKKRSENA
jgi:hypothetical protein